MLLWSNTEKLNTINLRDITNCLWRIQPNRTWSLKSAFLTFCKIEHFETLSPASEIRKFIKQWYTENHRMIDCCRMMHLLQQRIRLSDQNVFFAQEQSPLSRWWWQSACRNWDAPVWHSSILRSRSMEPTTVTCFCHNTHLHDRTSPSQPISMTLLLSPKFWQ